MFQLCAVRMGSVKYRILFDLDTAEPSLTRSLFAKAKRVTSLARIQEFPECVAHGKTEANAIENLR